MAKLTTQARKDLSKSDFVFPDKAPGSGSYPIPDEAHARDALARSSGKPEAGAVARAVHKKFPTIDKGSSKREPGMLEKLARSK